MGSKWSRVFCIIQGLTVGHMWEGTLSFFWSGFVGGTQGDRLDIPLSLQVWGQKVMKVLFSEELSSRLCANLIHKWRFLSLGLPICLLQLCYSFFLPSYMLSFDTSQLNLSFCCVNDFWFSLLRPIHCLILPVFHECSLSQFPFKDFFYFCLQSIH